MRWVCGHIEPLGTILNSWTLLASDEVRSVIELDMGECLCVCVREDVGGHVCARESVCVCV